MFNAPGAGMIKMNLKSPSHKGSDPFAGEGQTPFRIGSKLRRLFLCCLMALPLAGSEGLAAETSFMLIDAVRQHDKLTGRGLVRSMIRQGVDVDATAADGMSALHWAVYQDDAVTTRMLIDAGADVQLANRYGITPLALACKNGSGKIVGWLLDAGADPNTSMRGGETVLMTAARTGKVAPVKKLIAAGADLDAKEWKGQTALMWAAADGHVDVVDALLRAGADFTTPLDSGFTPFFFAIRQGHADVMFRLLEAGIDVNDPILPPKPAPKTPRKGMTPLVLAVENGHFQLALSLLEAGADPNDDRAGYTSLHAIVSVRKPIRGDGDPPPIGSGALSSLDLVQALVSYGADVNALHGKQNAPNGRLNRTGATPLLLAAESGDVPLLRLLVELGADPLFPNVDQCTPLLAAAGVGVLSNGDETAGTEEEAIETVRFLMQHGADLNAVDNDGKTAMHGAAFKSWVKMVQFLADNGAEIEIWNRKNKQGWTPLKIAQGHRPGNFRPSPATIAAVEKVMRAAGVEPPHE